MLAEDLGGLDQGHLGAEDAGRPDPQDQLVVVGPLADAGVLDVVLDPVDRAEAGVDRDDADLEVVGVSLGRRAVAPAVLDGHFQVERHVVGQGAEDVVGIDDLDRLVVEDVGGGDDAPAVAVDPDRPGRFGVVLDHQQLDVQDQVGDVVDHAGDRGKLVLDPQDLDLGDGAALQAGEQDPPQAVADGVAEAALEGFDVKLAERVGQASRGCR